MRQLREPQARLISPPHGIGHLPVFELDQEVVAKSTFANRLLQLLKANFHPSEVELKQSTKSKLRFQAWPFFHAIKKTELACSFTRRQLDKEALAFADSLDDLVVWNISNLRIRDRGVQKYKDASRTYLAGRFAEGVANLVMYEKGYVFWDHLPSLWRRAIQKEDVRHSESIRRGRLKAAKWRKVRPTEEPDFVYETTAGVVALVESKGGFIQPGKTLPDVTSRLRKALHQVEAWTSYINPVPDKSFAIATFIREYSDLTGDSIIAFVDPDLPKVPHPFAARFSKDWIHRGNYGAWLVGLGFESAGEALRSGIVTDSRDVKLPILNLPNGRFAFTIEAPLFPLDDRYALTEWLNRMKDFYRQSGRKELVLDWYGYDAPATWKISGIHVDVLKVIGKALTSRDDTSLLDIKAVSYPRDTKDAAAFSVRDEEIGFNGSVLPDGTLFGEVDGKRLLDCAVESFVL